MFSGSDDRTVGVHETQTGKLVAVLSEHRGAVTALAYSAPYLASASTDFTVRIWYATRYNAYSWVFTKWSFLGQQSHFRLMVCRISRPSSCCKAMTMKYSQLPFQAMGTGSTPLEKTGS